MPPSQELDFTWLLSSLVNKVPHTRSALLLSSDGLKKSFHGLDADGADKLAAIASGLCALARTAAMEFGHRDGVRQVVAELDDVLLFVSAAGPGAVLAVVANRGADVGVLGYEMAQLIKRVPSYLATPARHPAAAPDTVIR
jgi:predicted regulator of Ras-like GTPase activity (Roadblock/LC7/MglB family)